ncbi:MAG TPA: hypothetical protein VF725_13775 [Ktedonobacterales bacterium]
MDSRPPEDADAAERARRLEALRNLSARTPATPTPPSVPRPHPANLLRRSAAPWLIPLLPVALLALIGMLLLCG